MEKRIRIVSKITAIGVIGVAISIFVTICSWLIPICITEPDLWGKAYKGDYEISVTNWDRTLMLMNWFAYMGLVCFTLSIALRLSVQYMKSQYFSIQTYSLIFKLGVCVMMVVVAYRVALNIGSLIFSSTVNGLSFWDIHYLYYESTEASLFFCGVFFCVIGWVMKIASEIKDENEAII